MIRPGFKTLFFHSAADKVSSPLQTQNVPFKWPSFTHRNNMLGFKKNLFQSSLDQWKIHGQKLYHSNLFLHRNEYKRSWISQNFCSVFDTSCVHNLQPAVEEHLGAVLFVEKASL